MKLNIQVVAALSGALAKLEHAVGHTRACSYYRNLNYTCDCGLQEAKDGLNKRLRRELEPCQTK